MTKIVEMLCDWNLETIVLRQQSQTFWFQHLFTLLKIVEDLKEIFCGLYVSIFTVLEMKTLRETFYIYFKITLILK